MITGSFAWAVLIFAAGVVAGFAAAVFIWSDREPQTQCGQCGRQVRWDRFCSSCTAPMPPRLRRYTQNVNCSQPDRG